MTSELLLALFGIILLLNVHILIACYRRPTIIVLVKHLGGDAEEGDEGGGIELPVHPDALDHATQSPGEA